MGTRMGSRLGSLLERYRVAEKGHRWLSKSFGALSSSEVHTWLPAGTYWAEVYELPFLEHLTLTLWALGLAGPIRVAGEAADPVGALLNVADSFEPKPENLPQGVTTSDAFCLWYSLCLSASAYGAHGRTLSKLVENVRNGDDDALIDAVRIDRSIVACPSIAHRIAKATLGGKRRFLKRLGTELRGTRGYRKAKYTDLRIILEALREVGDLESLSENERYRIFCEELELYPTQGKDPGSGLKKFIQRWLEKSENLRDINL